MTIPDLSWPFLTFPDLSWPFLTFLDLSWPFLTFPPGWRRMTPGRHFETLFYTSSVRIWSSMTFPDLSFRMTPGWHFVTLCHTLSWRPPYTPHIPPIYPCRPSRTKQLLAIAFRSIPLVLSELDIIINIIVTTQHNHHNTVRNPCISKSLVLVLVLFIFSSFFTN